MIPHLFFSSISLQSQKKTMVLNSADFNVSFANRKLPGAFYVSKYVTLFTN